MAFKWTVHGQSASEHSKAFSSSPQAGLLRSVLPERQASSRAVTTGSDRHGRFDSSAPVSFFLASPTTVDSQAPRPAAEQRDSLRRFQSRPFGLGNVGPAVLSWLVVGVCGAWFLFWLLRVFGQIALALQR